MCLRLFSAGRWQNMHSPTEPFFFCSFPEKGKGDKGVASFFFFLKKTTTRARTSRLHFPATQRRLPPQSDSDRTNRPSSPPVAFGDSKFASAPPLHSTPLLRRPQSRLASSNPSAPLARVAAAPDQARTAPERASPTRIRAAAAAGWGPTPRSCSESSPSSSGSHVRLLRRTFPRAVIN
jgi:hypothetical protein